jgi:dethiobiotin synthetase/adenosylmethionine--8-amino-7-oxononanoate aminotransferase
MTGTRRPQACRARRVPVIYDEVFTGLYRLGAPSGAALLGAAPDIACYAKLLTGGAAPLAATLASARVFDAFAGASKLDALLHGHSYTAYPAGCAAALASLAVLGSPDRNPNLCAPRADGGGACAGGEGGDPGAQCTATPRCAAPCGRLRPLWDEARAAALSARPGVARALALGTVLAVELEAAAPAVGGGSGAAAAPGYGSGGAAHVVAALRAAGVQARPLGAVVYLMVTPTTPPAVCDGLMGRLEAALDAAAAAAAAGGDAGGGGGAGAREGPIV